MGIFRTEDERKKEEDSDEESASLSGDSFGNLTDRSHRHGVTDGGAGERRKKEHGKNNRELEMYLEFVEMEVGFKLSKERTPANAPFQYGAYGTEETNDEFSASSGGTEEMIQPHGRKKLRVVSLSLAQKALLNLSVSSSPGRADSAAAKKMILGRSKLFNLNAPADITEAEFLGLEPPEAKGESEVLDFTTWKAVMNDKLTTLKIMAALPQNVRERANLKRRGENRENTRYISIGTQRL